MKTKLFISLIVVFLFALATVFATVDFNYSGWTSSSGSNSGVGVAKNTSRISGGWSFYCVGSGLCFYIDGGWLYIYDQIPVPGDGDYVEVLAND